MATNVWRNVAWFVVAAACGGSSPPPANPPTLTGAVLKPAGEQLVNGAPAKKLEARSFRINVLEAARVNDAYRHVLFTGKRTQLAVMTIPPKGDIGFESHANVEQLLFIASGQGTAIVDGVESSVGPGDLVVATPGTRHDVVNPGPEPLRIYTIYAPPNHIDGRLHPTKADADADRADEAFGNEVR